MPRVLSTPGKAVKRSETTLRRKSSPGAPSTRTCAHHWRIAPQGGPTSPGTCIHCGIERRFSNIDQEGVTDRRPPQSEAAAIRKFKRQEEATRRIIANLAGAFYDTDQYPHEEPAPIGAETEG